MLSKYIRLKSILGAALLTLSLGCGSKDKDDSSSSPPTPVEKDEKDKKDDEESTAPAPAPSTDRISDGKYYLTAGSIEAFDTAGNKLDPQALQVTGDYTWTVKHLENSKYEVTSTGSAKINNSNQVLVEVNCRGSQDVFVLDVTTSGAIRNLKQTETGCPQGLQPVAAIQMSVERVDANSFAYTVVNQNQGARVIETYTFKK